MYFLFVSHYKDISEDQSDHAYMNGPLRQQQTKK